MVRGRLRIADLFLLLKNKVFLLFPAISCYFLASPQLKTLAKTNLKKVGRILSGKTRR